MAGGTKSYRVTKGVDGKPVRELVSFHPKYANRVDDAVTLVRNDGTAYVKPSDWLAFVAKWGEGA
jgi:hypothetical protein